MLEIRDFVSNSLILTVSIIFLLSFAVQLIYWLFFYLKFVVTRPKSDLKTQYPPVSVIITARNEAGNLQNFLPSVLNQDYPDFQVVVVNHASTDESEFVLKRFEQEYKNLYVTHIPYSPASSHSKKLALLIGIKAARHNLLLFTDADCKPVSNQWIKLMVRNFDEKTKIVLGYGGYAKSRGLLDKWLRTDTAFIAMQYFGFALRGLPYMGVGRNIAWDKSFFMEKDPFKNHYHEQSGSDDLFVNHFGNKQNTKAEFHKKSFTVSVPPGSWKEWFAMKKRHFGSAKFYKFKYKFLLALEPLSRILLFVSAIAVFLITNFNLLVIFIFFIREILSWILFSVAAAKLSESNIWWFFPVYDFVQPVLNTFIFIAKKNKQKWI